MHFDLSKPSKLLAFSINFHEGINHTRGLINVSVKSCVYRYQSDAKASNFGAEGCGFKSSLTQFQNTHFPKTKLDLTESADFHG